MRNNNLKNKSLSLKIFTPRAINNQKFISYYKAITEDNNDVKLYNVISNKTNYSSFKQRESTISSNYTYSNTYSNEKIHSNIKSQCLLNNNRYSKFCKSNKNFIPSINFDNNFSKTNSMNQTLNSLQIKRKKIDKKKFRINLINTEELTKISTLLSSFKSPIKKKKKKYFHSTKKNFKYGSLLYHLNKKTKLNDKDIQNRYRPIIKEFFGKKDYKIFASKSEKFIRPEELKMLYRDTRIINSTLDYLNNSFLKFRYRQALINQKEKNELLQKKRNERNYYHNLEKEINLPLDNFIQIKKIIYDNNKDIFKTFNNDQINKENNILRKKILFKKNFNLKKK